MWVSGTVVHDVQKHYHRALKLKTAFFLTGLSFDIDYGSLFGGRELRTTNPPGKVLTRP